MPNETRQIFFCYQTVFDQLRAAHDRLQRRLQLVRNIRGKFPPTLLRAHTLRNIKDKDDRADDRTSGTDCADIQLIGLLPARKLNLAAALRESLRDCRIDLRTAFHSQKILSHAALVRFK